jgi:hypothetical protein
VTFEDLPADVKTFITQRLNSVAQLEILLLVRSGTERTWSAADVADTLKISADMARQQLLLLEHAGLLSVAADAPEDFRYAPKTPELAALMDALAAAYEERRVAVITLIYSKPVDKVRTFADAFRLRQEP